MKIFDLSTFFCFLCFFYKLFVSPEIWRLFIFCTNFYVVYFEYCNSCKNGKSISNGIERFIVEIDPLVYLGWFLDRKSPTVFLNHRNCTQFKINLSTDFDDRWRCS
jgi:hypothetical protein